MEESLENRKKIFLSKDKRRHKGWDKKYRNLYLYQ